MTKMFPPRKARRRARPAEFLDAETEQRLALAWRDEGNDAARNRLITAHRALALAAAARASGRGAETDDDLIQQAQMGLLKAADRFDPDRGVRFSTYAAWWIRSEIQDYKLRTFSLVRIGNSPVQRRVFFNMRRIEARLAAASPETRAELFQALSEELDIGPDQLALMRQRLAGRDASLNRTLDAAGDGAEAIDMLHDPETDTEAEVTARLDGRTFWTQLARHMTDLPERERDIVIATLIADEPRTLADLGAQYGISRERVRQLRERGLGRLRAAMAEPAAVAPDAA